MSDANRVAVRVIEESTFGTTPTSPAMQELRYNSSSLQYSPKTTVSEEIRSDRQVTDVILVGFETSGDIDTELSYGNLDILMRGAMFSDWVSTAERVNVTADSVITDVLATSGTFTVTTGTAFATGMLVKTTNFTNSGNSNIFVLTGGSATTAVVGAGAGTVNETAPPAGARIKQIGLRGTSGDITAAVSPNRLSSTTLNFTTMNLAVGMWVKVGGSAVGTRFATSALNDWCRISNITATSLEFDAVPSGWAVDSGTGKTISVFFGDYMRNGVTERSFTLEQEYAGMAVPEFEYYRGMEVSALAIDLQTQDIMKAKVSFMGKDATIGTSRVSGATTVTATTNDVMSTSSHIGQIREGGSAVASPNFVISAALNIENNLRMQNAIGSVSAVGIGVGRCNVSGSLETYFGSSAILQKLRNNTATSFDYRVEDSTKTKAYIFDLPRVKFSGGNANVSGIDTDLVLPLEFTAMRHSTLGYTIQIQRVEYYEV